MSQTDEILDILAKKAMVDRSQITPSTKLTDINLSSLDLVELIFMFEDKFGIELPFNANTTGMDIQTVGDVITRIEQQLTKKSAAS